MGGSPSKQDIMANIKQLEQQELDINLKLKDMQVELNGMVPKDEQIKVNKNLTANSKIISSYTEGHGSTTKSSGAKS